MTSSSTILQLLIIILLLHFTSASSNNLVENDEFYTAAVVEFAPEGVTPRNVSREEAQTIMLKNLQHYDFLISSTLSNYTGSKRPQIFVFPEYGIYGSAILSTNRDNVLNYLEYLAVGSTPCDSLDSNSPIQNFASCMAKKHEITLVLNMGDVEKCTAGSACPSADGRLQYNTQVAFNEQGKILAKYHKHNLYYEDKVFNRGDGKGVWFETSFGVRFGMFICFDILFEKPQVELFQQGIKNFVYSSWWVNFPPIINALQTQQGIVE